MTRPAYIRLASRSQAVVQDLSRAAIFLVVTINLAVRIAGGSGLFRRPPGAAACGRFPRHRGKSLLRPGDWIRRVGQALWPTRPAELHPFREIKAGSRHAVATPGDLLFHIRATRMDLCFELATQIMARLGEAVSPVDEVHGSAISTSVISSALSMARRTRRSKRRSTPLTWAPKTPPSPAAAM